ncbi:Kruppel-like factor 4 (gut), isoform CRA_b [Rattus norvegicus]|uniref:Kruppel-like factor 4 (Gut), isoform CRA_b n=1 Tax=Rattus norvegicus TaxID=10116 RepID=A6KDQ9_RAT|nr:Kruppel-like factor 4 (gut), isoform CRA_b [Rattus norvegicus]
MRQPPGESDMAVSDALLPSFSTFASGPAGREKTLRPAGAPTNRWREELSHMKRLPPLPATLLSCQTRCSRKSPLSIIKSSCHRDPACQRSPSQRGEEGLGPGKEQPPTLVTMQAVAKPIRRVLISRHTCELTQARNLTTVTGTAVGGNSPAQMN